MPTYIIQAAARIDAADDSEARAKLDGIARILSDGDGELGYDWWLDAGRGLAHEPPQEQT